MAEISLFDPAMLVLVDESRYNHKNTVRINSIGIISYHGMEDVYILEDNVDSDTFEDFCRKCLIPLLMPFNGINTHSVVMDNCSVHHRVTEMIYSTGALIRFLPPYSPDLNPIELVFSKVNSFVKANKLVFQYSPRIVVSMAFNTITQEDCIHYIQHCGYSKAFIHYENLYLNNNYCQCQFSFCIRLTTADLCS